MIILVFPLISLFSFKSVGWFQTHREGQVPNPCSRPSPGGERPPPQKCSQLGEAARTPHASGGTRAVPAPSLVPLTQFPLRSGVSPISVRQADVTAAGKAVQRPRGNPPSPPCRYGQHPCQAREGVPDRWHQLAPCLRFQKSSQMAHLGVQDQNRWKL